MSLRPGNVAAPAVAAVTIMLGLAGCAMNADSEQVAATPATSASPSSAVEPMEGYVDLGDGISIPEGGPGACDTMSMVNITKQDDGPWTAKLLGPDPVDMGAREFANGEVGYAEDGRIATYTVAAGDAIYAISDRFCMNGGHLPNLHGNAEGYGTIQPDDVLVLNPGAIPDYVYVHPYDD